MSQGQSAPRRPAALPPSLQARTAHPCIAVGRAHTWHSRECPSARTSRPRSPKTRLRSESTSSIGAGVPSPARPSAWHPPRATSGYQEWQPSSWASTPTNPPRTKRAPRGARRRVSPLPDESGRLTPYRRPFHLATGQPRGAVTVT